MATWFILSLFDNIAGALLISGHYLPFHGIYSKVRTYLTSNELN